MLPDLATMLTRGISPHTPVSWTKGEHTRTITAHLFLDAAEHGFLFG